MAEQDELIAAVVKDDTVRARATLDHDPHLLRMRTPNGTLVLTAVYHGANKALGLLLERTPEDALSLHEAAATGNARCSRPMGSADSRHRASRWLAWLATSTNEPPAGRFSRPTMVRRW